MTKRPALKLVVSGGRTYSDEGYVAFVMKKYQKLAKDQGKILVVTQGGARGLDTLVRNWCKAHGVPCCTWDALWDFYGNAAGPVRNGWMVEFMEQTHGFVFPGDTGTADMKKKMAVHGLAVETYEEHPND